jgi:hypothetical protein
MSMRASLFREVPQPRPKGSYWPSTTETPMGKAAHPGIAVADNPAIPTRKGHAMSTTALIVIILIILLLGGGGYGYRSGWGGAPIGGIGLVILILIILLLLGVV